MSFKVYRITLEDFMENPSLKEVFTAVYQRPDTGDYYCVDNTWSGYITSRVVALNEWRIDKKWKLFRWMYKHGWLYHKLGEMTNWGNIKPIAYLTGLSWYYNGYKETIPFKIQAWIWRRREDCKE